MSTSCPLPRVERRLLLLPLLPVLLLVERLGAARVDRTVLTPFGGGEVRGRALVFPTACASVGTPDERYVHSGEAVGGGEKWIVGTWLMEAEREQGSATKGGAPAYEYE